MLSLSGSSGTTTAHAPSLTGPSVGVSVTRRSVARAPCSVSAAAAGHLDNDDDTDVEFAWSPEPHAAVYVYCLSFCLLLFLLKRVEQLTANMLRRVCAALAEVEQDTPKTKKTAAPQPLSPQCPSFRAFFVASSASASLCPHHGLMVSPLPLSNKERQNFLVPGGWPVGGGVKNMQSEDTQKV